MGEMDFDKLRSMIARSQWTYAKTMPFAPHEYIVRGKCPLSEEEFLYFINMQRNYGKVERWGNTSSHISISMTTNTGQCGHPLKKQLSSIGPRYWYNF